MVLGRGDLVFERGPVRDGLVASADVAEEALGFPSEIIGTPSQERLPIL
jgi:hypothetical protein